MHILISTQEADRNLIFEGVKACFSQEFPAEMLTWEHSGPTISTSASQIEEKDITRVFEALVKKYPGLKVEASFSYDVREDDRSAQWWGVTKIYSEQENGETKIVSSSSTYWN